MLDKFILQKRNFKLGRCSGVRRSFVLVISDFFLYLFQASSFLKEARDHSVGPLLSCCYKTEAFHFCYLLHYIIEKRLFSSNLRSIKMKT